MGYPVNYERICIDRYQRNDVSGRIYSKCLAKEVEFDSTAALLLRMEDILDIRGKPQAFQKKRTFRTPDREPSGTARRTKQSEPSGTARRTKQSEPSGTARRMKQSEPAETAGRTEPGWLPGGREKEEPGFSDEEIIRQRGNCITYDVMVHSRMYTTCQGIVKDIHGNLLGEFESELRLLEIMFKEMLI